MKTIRDLVAGVTGFDATRGDQLIVETLPFESGVTTDDMQFAPGPSPKPDLQPAWLEAINKYRNMVFMAVGALLALSVVIKMVLRYMPGRSASRAAAERASEELEVAAALRRVAAQQGAVAVPGHQDSAMPAESRQLLAEVHAETAERIRQLAQKDPSVSANVLRMWLHNQKT
jgi:flagellar M-ring protein FliF